MSKLYPIELFESARDHEDVALPELHKPVNLRRKANLRSIAVFAVLVPGLFVTVALPAYGATTGAGSDAHAAADGLTAAQNAHAQAVLIDASAEATPTIHRDLVGYIKPVVAAPIVHQRFTGLVQSYGSISITGIAAIAAKYLGVPYVYGGESPAGFDCSGLVEYVYAQVGIHLPHSSMLQGEMGTRVSLANARPGDVLVFNGGSHVGIYIDAGHMIDAPYPGRVVSIDKIYTNAYWIVHF